MSIAHRVEEHHYAWGRAELVRRDAECRGLRGYEDYVAMKQRWEKRQRDDGITDAVRKHVIRAALDLKIADERAWFSRRSA